MDELTLLADEYYDHAMSESPLSLMWVGKLNHLDEWDDFSDAGVERRKEINREFVRRADAIDPGTDPARVALHAVLRNAAEAAVKGSALETPLFHVNPKMGAFEMVEADEADEGELSGAMATPFTAETTHHLGDVRCR